MHCNTDSSATPRNDKHKTLNRGERHTRLSRALLNFVRSLRTLIYIVSNFVRAIFTLICLVEIHLRHIELHSRRGEPLSRRVERSDTSDSSRYPVP